MLWVLRKPQVFAGDNKGLETGWAHARQGFRANMLVSDPEAIGALNFGKTNRCGKIFQTSHTAVTTFASQPNSSLKPEMPPTFYEIISFRRRQTSLVDSVSIPIESATTTTLSAESRPAVSTEMRLKDVPGSDDGTINVQTPAESLAKPKDGCCGGGCH